MTRIQAIDRWEGQHDIARHTDVPEVGREDWLASRPERHCLVVGQDGHVAARASLWWRSTPILNGKRVGFIGHYAACDSDSGRQLLNHACLELAANGMNMVLGPLDGSTWNRYRLVVWKGQEPPFFLEPQNPGFWVDDFAKSGFSPVANYYSALNVNLAHRDSRLDSVRDRLAGMGLIIRPFETRRYEQEFRGIYEVIEQSFQRSFLFEPLPWKGFIEKHRRLLGMSHPKFVLIAEQAGRTVGFVLGIPDFVEKERIGTCSTLIVKTVAVLPGRQWAGLGKLLVEECQLNALEHGFSRVIHALMHQSNKSLNLSRAYAKPFRTYCLFGRPLLG